MMVELGRALGGAAPLEQHLGSAQPVADLAEEVLGAGEQPVAKSFY
jgi:hypothetical protein